MTEVEKKEEILEEIRTGMKEELNAEISKWSNTGDLELSHEEICKAQEACNEKFQENMMQWIHESATDVLTMLSEKGILPHIAHGACGTAFVRIALTMGFDPEQMKMHLDNVLEHYKKFWQQEIERKEAEKSQESNAE